MTSASSPGMSQATTKTHGCAARQHGGVDARERTAAGMAVGHRLDAETREALGPVRRDDHLRKELAGRAATVRTAIGSPPTAANALSRPPMREARPPARITPVTVVVGERPRSHAAPVATPRGRPQSTVDTERRRGERWAAAWTRTARALEAAADCLARARYVIALTGAGLSVESGIPPFRGPGGLWTKHGEPPMNGYQRFLADPRKAWEERLNPSGPMRELWDALARARARIPATTRWSSSRTWASLRAIDHAERRQPAPPRRQPPRCSRSTATRR